MTEPLIVEQGTPLEHIENTYLSSEFDEETLSAAIEAIEAQASIYRDAGLTQVSHWFE